MNYESLRKLVRISFFSRMLERDGASKMDSLAAKRARAERFKREFKAGPPPVPTKRLAHPGGKIVTSDKEQALKNLLARKLAQGAVDRGGPASGRKGVRHGPCALTGSLPDAFFDLLYGCAQCL